MKSTKVLTQLFVCASLLCNSACATDSLVTGSGSSDQWPMSGGPDGSWRVTTSFDVPTEWSVRSGENIKWKTELPAGGQSGIAVWGDKLFLTINPPTDHLPLIELKTNYEDLQNRFKILYDETWSRLRTQNDADFVAVELAQKNAIEAWVNLLDTDEPLKKAHGGQIFRIKAELLKNNPVGKAFTKYQAEFVSFVDSKGEGLTELHAEFLEADKAYKSRGDSADVVLYCIHSDSGEILWSKLVKGVVAANYDYGFSDSTTPCPATDGNHVWAINASGGMACFTVDGARLWERTWMPTVGRPFNKQYDSILHENWILNVEPPADDDSERNKDWNYLHAFNKLNGERAWVSKDALTHYNAPVIGKTIDGESAVMIGRGGPHEVPERPVGLSLVSLANENAGSSIWSWEPKDENGQSGWGALFTQHWDTEKVSWFYKQAHVSVNFKTGTATPPYDLITADQYDYNDQQGTHTLAEAVKVDHFDIQRHTNISVGDQVYYMVRYNPYIARHDMKTGKNVRIEVPQEFDEAGAAIWHEKQKNDGLNAKGQRHARDNRILGGGFQKCFLGSPTMINDYLYFTSAIGLVYVVDTKADPFDASAIIAVNDLGARGETWTVNSMSYANGHIYHRTMKELICIGEK